MLAINGCNAASSFYITPQRTPHPHIQRIVSRVLRPQMQCHRFGFSVIVDGSAMSLIAATAFVHALCTGNRTQRCHCGSSGGRLFGQRGRCASCTARISNNGCSAAAWAFGGNCIARAAMRLCQRGVVHRCAGRSQSRSTPTGG